MLLDETELRSPLFRMDVRVLLLLAVAAVVSPSGARALMPPTPNSITIELADPAAPFRIATLSDTHVIGPQYKIGSEGSENDNLSVLKTQQRLFEVRGPGHKRAHTSQLAPELVNPVVRQVLFKREMKLG